ncbi:MAG: HAD family hydrolase [Solirubrobacteraceae bacterium]
MALPKTIEFVTMDVYGTLIDWESAIVDAFQREAGKDGFTIDKDRLLASFHEKHREVAAGSYELYAEVLRRTAREVAADLGWDDLKQEPARANFLPDSVIRWRPFREAMPQLRKLGKEFKTGLVSNIDDKLLGQTRRHIPHEFDLVVTAQQVRSYKPDAAHFTEIARRYGSKKNWVHIASGYHADIAPCIKAKVPVIWINRHGEELEKGVKQPTVTVKTLLDAVRELGLK